MLCCETYLDYWYLIFRDFMNSNKYRSWIGLTACTPYFHMCWEKGCRLISYNQWEGWSGYLERPSFINSDFRIEMDQNCTMSEELYTSCFQGFTYDACNSTSELECTLCTKEGEKQKHLLLLLQ